MTMHTEIEAAVPALRRYAWSLLRHPQDADDLVQDCLVRALGHAPAPSSEEGTRRWLFTIMHNLSVSRWRTLRRRGTPVEHAAEPSVPAAQEDRLLTRDLLRGLSDLPVEQRQVLLLVTVEGFGYREVAAILGVPIGTVMSRLSRARDALRSSMEGRVRPALRRVK